MATIPTLEIEEFKSAAQKADLPEDFQIRKQGEFEVTKDADDKRILQFVYSTNDADRDNDTIQVDGWDLRNYRKAGTFLWAHNYRIPPIGKPKRVWIEDEKLKGKVEFLDPRYADHEHAKFADMIYRMYKDGFMKATSVGFRPMKWKINEEREGLAVDFLKQELLEVSAVPVPSNPNALLDAKSAGIDISPLIWWATKEAEEGRITKNLFEHIRDAAGDKRIVLVSLKHYGIDGRLELSFDSDPVEQETETEEKSEEKGPISYKQAHPDGTPLAAEDAEWNKGEQVAKADIDELRVMCTWVDPENAENKSGYKLPHHNAGDDNPCVWRGVSAAMGALLGARGGVDIPEDDKAAVHAHLAKHYKEFEKEVPELKEYDESEIKELFEDCEFVDQPDSGETTNESPGEAPNLPSVENDQSRAHETTTGTDNVEYVIVDQKSQIERMEERLAELEEKLADKSSPPATDDINQKLTAEHVARLVEAAREETRKTIRRLTGRLED